MTIFSSIRNYILPSWQQHYPTIWSISWTHLMLFTDCVHSMREGYVLTHVCPSIHLSVHPHLGGTAARSSWRGVPQPGPAGGVPWQGGTPPRVPPSQVRMGAPTGYPPGQVRMGGTPARGAPTQGTPPSPSTGQHMEYFISGDRYAACVHVGVLSC